MKRHVRGSQIAAGGLCQRLERAPRAWQVGVAQNGSGSGFERRFRIRFDLNDPL